MNGQHRGNEVYFDFTQRQQLFHIYAAGGIKWFEFTYDKNGNLIKRPDKFQGLDSTNFQYDTLSRVTLCEQTGANDVSFARSHYDYDVLSNVQDTWREEQGNKGERYGYDFANQLKSVVYNANNVTTTTPSGYDRNVSYNNTPLNRASVNDNGAVTSYTSNGLNQYTAVTGQTPAYDPNFNLTSYKGWTYVYDADGRLTSASATGHSAQFVYDGLGRCIKRTIDGVVTLFSYDGWKPIVEWDGTGNFVASNVYGAGADEILMRYQVNVGYLHYHLDRQGNVAFLLNTSNTGIEKYTYDVFGQPKITDWNGNVRTTSAYANRFMFTSREYLTALGIYDYRNRFYLPSLGRFLQSDPIGFAGGDNNLFRYCAGDPVNHSDPTGQVTSESKKQNNAINPGPSWGDLNWALGTVPGAISTQGFWSTPSGLPTGTANFLAATEAIARGFEGFDSQTGAPVYQAQPVTENVFVRILSTVVNFFTGRLGATTYPTEAAAAVGCHRRNQSDVHC